MNRVQSGWLTAIVAAVAVCGGCAGTDERESSWPSLPSPWSTVKESPPRSANSKDAAPSPAADSRAEATPRAPAKGRETKDDASQAMTILNSMNLERAGEWEKAREIYEEIRKKDPENIEAAHRLRIVADAQRRHTEAEQLLLDALEREPRNAALLADLGYCYYLQGQLAKAESALTKATRIEPSNQRYWKKLGLVVGHQGRYEDDVDDIAVADDVRYAPLVEGVNPGDNDGAVANTSFTASRVARALHQESRGMLNRNMASERSDQLAKE
jgi:tetratricopeptide (TPR) repeat protein